MRTKLLGILGIVLGVFLFTGIASASTTQILQPASAFVVNEDLTVNGVLRATSMHIGQAGVGGVSYFYGTIMNPTVDPIMIGDDLDVMGEIWRNKKGDQDGMPIKMSDSLIPTLDNINKLGYKNNRWSHFYSVQGNFSGNLQVNGVTGLSDTDIPNTLTASNYLPLLGGTLSGSLSVNGISGLVDSDIPDTITVANYLPTEGGLLTGGLTVNGVTGLLDDDIPNTITASNYLQLAGGILSGGLTVNGVTGLIDSDIPDTITASNYLLLTGGTITGSLIVNGDISSGGDVNVSKVTATQGLTVSQSSLFNGDIIQDIGNNGAVKALVNALGTGGCTRSWASSTTTPIACTRVSEGYYEINFPYDINNRYWQATAATTSPVFVSAMPSATSADIMFINTYIDGDTHRDVDFMLNIY